MPVEILQRTLKYLDIETLVNIRRCSQYCRSVVTSILEWQEVSDIAPEALRAILATKVGSYIPLLQLHYALTNPECEFCHENADIGDPANNRDPEYLDGEKVVGGFLSLFEGKRACAYCLRNDISLRTIQYIDLIRLRCIPNCAIKFPADNKFLVLRTIPDLYGPMKFKSPQRLALVPFGSIEIIPGMELNVNDRRVLQLSPHEIFIPKHPFCGNRTTMDTQLGPHSEYVGFEREGDIARRYMTAIPFPYFGKSKTHPNNKKRLTYHVCAECYLQERYHKKQFLESFNTGDADETIIGCAGRIYKRVTRMWLDDPKAEKRHARRFHDEIDEQERAWRQLKRAPIFDLKDPKTWLALRLRWDGFQQGQSWMFECW